MNNMTMENQYFKAALHNFVADIAYVKSIRHLYDLGYDLKRIQDNISYPVPIETIEKVVADYKAEQNSPDSDYEIVETTDRLGNRSFVRKKKLT